MSFKQNLEIELKTYEYIRPLTQERVTVETIETDIQNHNFDFNFEYFIPEWDDIVEIESEYGGTVKTKCGQSIFITDCSFYKILSKRNPTDEEFNNSLASYYTVRDFLGPTDEKIN